jgi:c(7)-type cytochrome triheme protein
MTRLRETSSRRWGRLALVGLAGLLFLGAGMPHLPKDRALPQTGDSPGVVTFRHVTHVNEARPDCTVCHPRPFRILAPTGPRAPITHDQMKAGRLCGSCHDGKKAAGLEDDCTACHRTE